MNRREQRVRLRRQDRTSDQPLPVLLRPPGLPQSAERERLAFIQRDRIRLPPLLAGHVLPFKKNVGRNQASSLLHRGAERWLLERSVRTDVGHSVTDSRVPGPRRYQTPADHFGLRHPLPLANDEDVAGGRDVESRLLRGDLPRDAEAFEVETVRSGESETAAHVLATRDVRGDTTANK